ncbi:hypothetical protein [Bacterioplanoides sp.]|uniref:hypothetical protein n=1 Tax=Bacterioplanoides sp. TaxID=2066072 RepID=UPI003B00FE7A
MDTQAYDKLAAHVGHVLHIESEEAYSEALAVLDDLFEIAGDDKDDRYGFLIDAIAKAIDEYEMSDPDIATFVAQSDSIPVEIAVLRTLIDQHDLRMKGQPKI